MKILAINSGHNATAGIFEDGKCLCIYHEEKFTNKKNHKGIPYNVLDYLNKNHRLSEVDLCIFAFIEQIIPEEDTAGLIERIGARPVRKLYNRFIYTVRKDFINNLIRKILIDLRLTPRTQKNITAVMSDRYNVDRNKVVFTDHHTNHCLTPLFFFGIENMKENILLVSLDGAGDGLC